MTILFGLMDYWISGLVGFDGAGLPLFAVACRAKADDLRQRVKAYGRDSLFTGCG